MKIERVIIWTNGTVMVFDNMGKQVPKLQTTIFNMKKLKKYCDKDTRFYFGKWTEWIEPLNIKWIFEENKNE